MPCAAPSPKPLLPEEEGLMGWRSSAPHSADELTWFVQTQGYGCCEVGQTAEAAAQQERDEGRALVVEVAAAVQGEEHACDHRCHEPGRQHHTADGADE